MRTAPHCSRHLVSRPPKYKLIHCRLKLNQDTALLEPKAYHFWVRKITPQQAINQHSLPRNLTQFCGEVTVLKNNNTAHIEMKFPEGKAVSVSVSSALK